MNIPATPPGSDGPLDRLAELAEGLWQRVEEDGGGLGGILFVLVVMHYLLRFAALYVRVKAGLLAPHRTEGAKGPLAAALDRADPHATPLPASQVEASGEAQGRRERIPAAFAPATDTPGDQQARAPDADAPIVTVVSLTLTPPDAPGYSIRAAYCRCAYRRPRPNAPSQFSTGRDTPGFVRPFRCDIATLRAAVVAGSYVLVSSCGAKVVG